jgi:integrase/recombinase XerD
MRGEGKGQGKQAKIVQNGELKKLLDLVAGARNPERDRVIVLLSFKAGLRAKEIAKLTWGMVTGADGAVCDEIALTNGASKGQTGGRTIPMHAQLREALQALATSRPDKFRHDLPVIYSERARGYSAARISIWFGEHYRALGIKGASSHSGRRTFITMAARKVVEAGGSLRDVQQLAGHSALSTTQGYIEGSTQAKRNLIKLI